MMQAADDFFWIDTFSDTPFRGNPATVCIVRAWPDEHLMQRFSAEMNLSETAFIKPEGEDFRIRWFTPTVELGLVGHATLAAAHAILHVLQPRRRQVRFIGREGVIQAGTDAARTWIALPADPLQPAQPPSDLVAGLGVMPARTFKGRHYVAMLASEAEVAALRPDFGLLARLDRPTIAVTAPGDHTDYVLRFFAPANGVPEDPVSGVAQCSLAPLWGKLLGRADLASRQLSSRGAAMHCRLDGDKVAVSGPCTLLLRGRMAGTLWRESASGCGQA